MKCLQLQAHDPRSLSRAELHELTLLRVVDALSSATVHMTHCACRRGAPAPSAFWLCANQSFAGSWTCKSLNRGTSRFLVVWFQESGWMARLLLVVEGAKLPVPRELAYSQKAAQLPDNGGKLWQAPTFQSAHVRHKRLTFGKSWAPLRIEVDGATVTGWAVCLAQDDRGKKCYSMPQQKARRSVQDGMRNKTTTRSADGLSLIVFSQKGLLLQFWSCPGLG